jgi:hypothetical protein
LTSGELYTIVFCDPLSNMKVRVGWVVVKQVAHGGGEVFHLDGGSEVDT